MGNLIEDFTAVAIQFLQDQDFVHAVSKERDSSRRSLGSEIWYMYDEQDVMVAVKTDRVKDLNYYAGLEYIDKPFVIGEWAIYRETNEAESRQMHMSEKLSVLLDDFLSGK